MKKNILVIVSIVLGIMLLLGASYAIFKVTIESTNNNVINAGTLKLTFDDESSNAISLTEAVPVTDERGMKGTAYNFTVTNTGTLPVNYNLKIEEDENLYKEHQDEGNIFADNKLKIGITENGYTRYLLYSRQTLDIVRLEAGESKTYTIHIWIDYNAGNEVQGNHFHGKFIVDGVQGHPVTDESCFTRYPNSGSITSYKCYEGNTYGMPVITDVVIPKIVEGREVTGISGNALSYKQLTSVVIPDTVITIDTKAFANNQITNIVIPDSVTTIGVSAFANNQISEIVIPSNVQTIGTDAFVGNQLTNITFSEGLTSIGGRAFQNCKLTKVSFPSTLTSIAGSAFQKNQLTEVMFSEGLTTIGLAAFSGNLLTHIELPNTLITIDSSAFLNNQLKTLEIPDSVETIGNNAFQNNQLTSVRLSNRLTSIGGYAFYVNHLTDIVIPSSVTTIKSYAFLGNQLQRVTIEGKSSSADFTTYGSNIWGWASGYSDSNITWQP